MAMNRVQFQPGLSMTEFMDLYGSDEKCEAGAGRIALACWLCLLGVRLRPEQFVSP